MGIVNATDVSDEIKHYLKTGGKKRYYLGHKCVDKHYGIREGSRTDWTGYPGSGKTELLLECLWNCSNYYDHKHLIYMPDSGEKVEVISKLFHKVTGKRLERFYWTKNGKQEGTNLATEQEIDRYLPEVLHYFKVFEAPKSHKPSPVEFWKYAVKMKKELGVFSAVIDSWNHLNQNTHGERSDIWLAQQLQEGNDLVEESGMHFHTIIHPRSTRIKDGKIQPPTFHEMKGGSEWGNYGKSIIVVHWEKGQEYTEIHFEKIKGANIGVKGMETMYFDLDMGKYYEVRTNELNPNELHWHYAKPLGQDESDKTTTLENNLNKYAKEDDLPF